VIENLVALTGIESDPKPLLRFCSSFSFAATVTSSSSADGRAIIGVYGERLPRRALHETVWERLRLMSMLGLTARKCGLALREFAEASFPR
jgi:hypothetical protein